MNSFRNMNQERKFDYGYNLSSQQIYDQLLQWDYEQSLQSKISFSKSSTKNSQPSLFIDDAAWDKYVCKSSSGFKPKKSSEVKKLISLSECGNEDFVVSAGWGTGVYADEETIKKRRNGGKRRKAASYIIGNDGKEKINEFKGNLQSITKSKCVDKEIKVEVHEDEIKDTITQKDDQLIYEDQMMFNDAVEEMNLVYCDVEEDISDDQNGAGEVLDNIEQEHQGVLEQITIPRSLEAVFVEEYPDMIQEEDINDAVESIGFMSEDVLMKIQKEYLSILDKSFKRQKEYFSMFEESFNSKSVDEKMKIEVETVKQIYDSKVEINDIETQIQVEQKTKKKVTFSEVVDILDEEESGEEYEDTIEEILESTEEGYISILETDIVKHNQIQSEEILNDVEVIDVNNVIAEDIVINLDKEKGMVGDALKEVLLTKENEVELIRDSFEKIEKEHNIKKKREIDKELQKLLIILPIQAQFKIKLFKFLFKYKYKSKLPKVFIKKVFGSNSVVLFDKFNKWLRKRRLKSGHNNVSLKSKRKNKVRVAENGKSMLSLEKECIGKKVKEIDQYLNKSFSIYSIKDKSKPTLQSNDFEKKQQLRFKIVFKFIQDCIKFYTKKLYHMLPDVIGKVEKWSRKVRMKLSHYKFFTRCEIYKQKKRRLMKLRKTMRFTLS
ncbi:hypothetical protein DFH28DRAFT_1109972 [Melampsora americana]|nr:hypothetical protein DFH28DRAFT_1109972 [Melampsora americana]